MILVLDQFVLVICFCGEDKLNNQEDKRRIKRRRRTSCENSDEKGE